MSAWGQGEPDIPFLRSLDDEADALYTLASGAIGISRRDPRTGTIRRVARLRPPVTVGDWAPSLRAPNLG